MDLSYRTSNALLTKAVCLIKLLHRCCLTTLFSEFWYVMCELLDSYFSELSCGIFVDPIQLCCRVI